MHLHHALPKETDADRSTGRIIFLRPSQTSSKDFQDEPQIFYRAALAATALALVPAAALVAAAPATLLNVSYDPTRELYVAVNAAFARDWKAKTGQDVVIRQSQ